MQRSRRQRLSELYGDQSGISQSGTPVRKRLAKQQLEHSFVSETPRKLEQKPAIKTEAPQPTHHILKNNSPLIPTTVLDVGSQRAAIAVLFTILQSYKLYDLILLKNNLPLSSFLGFPSQHFNFITKYFFYDSVFLYFLPALRIPSLSFSRTIVLLQIVLLVLINLFLASDFSFPLTTVLFAAWKRINTKDLTILGNAVNSEIHDTTKHFKGSHTIKILPENTAFLNPFQESFCLPLGATNFKQNIPIRFNSTNEIDFLQVKYTDFDTNVPILLNYTKKNIKKFDTRNINSLYERDTVSGPNIHYLNLPVSKTGLYEINQVSDSKYLGLRSYRSSLIVPYCPTAQIDEIPEDKCPGGIYSVKLTVDGVPPLKMKYTKLINRNVQKFDDQSLQPEFFQSPLLSGISKSFTKQQLSDLSWAKSRSVEVELENPVNEVGDYTYRIDEIVDGLGNVVNFTSTLKGNDDLFRKYDLLQSFHVHESPKVQLFEKVNEKTLTKKSLYLKADSSSDSAPFEAQFRYTSEDERETKTFKHVFQNSEDEFPVENPGIYTLISVDSKHCPSTVKGRSSFSISSPIPPKALITSKPITDTCVGQVGLTFDFSFVGTPPFKFEQQIYKIDNNKRTLSETKRLTSQGTRYKLTYEPSTEGDYEIVFDNLVSSLYQDPIKLTPVEDYTYTTSMRVKPSADISNHKNSKGLCLGSQDKVPIKLKGESPFQLEYEIIEVSTNKRKSYSAKDIIDDTYEILTPEFIIGGEYILSLTSVEDKSSCLVGLNSADAYIKVKREAPSVEFSGSETTIKIKEGDKAELPLRILGEDSFTVEYSHLDLDGNYVSNHSKTFRNSNKASLEVSDAGIYVLKSVKDSDCQGVVYGVDTFQVVYHTKPSVSITEHEQISKIGDGVFEKQKVCQFDEASIELSLHGSPPFIIDYTVVSPDGRRSQETLSVATKFASIRLPNTIGGEYKYFINGVYDALYSKYDLDKIRYEIDQIVVKQVVNSSPRGEFKDKRKSYRTCTTNLLDENILEPIKLNLQGDRSPFTVSFEIFHESSSKAEFLTLENIDSTSELKELYHGLRLGNHIVSIIKIVDTDGCIQEDFAESNYVSISVSDTPKINQLDSSVNYCVGDNIGYQLIGTPPFTIVYSFNEVNLKSVESTSQFVRYASAPGTISVQSVQDSSSNCVVNFTLPENKDRAESLDIVIHSIPSVEVSQGDEIVQDIHEGDQAEIIFSFEGIPPFSLTYVRLEDVEVKKGKKKSQVVETHTVNDIYAYEYRVLTSLQGTYEAIEVSDAYCIARNE